MDRYIRRRRCELWLPLLSKLLKCRQYQYNAACVHQSAEPASNFDENNGVMQLDYFCIAYIRHTVKHARVLAFSHLRTLTMCHCPHSPAAAAAVDRYFLPAGPTAANLQQRVCCCGHMLGQTDGRTDTVPFHRPCSACYAGSIDNSTSSGGLR